MTTALEALMDAIARVEGFYLSETQAKGIGCSFPTIPQRTNNPGDLMYAGQPGAVPFPVKGKDGKVRHYAQFKRIEDGWAALRRQIEKDAGRDLTLAEFINKYAPAADANDPKAYCNIVAKRMGVSPQDKLSSVIS